MQRYNPNEIESKWQKTWEDNKSYVIKDDDPRPKFYALVEFPYPSGVGLHVGHCRPYITFDVLSRWRRMTGENVLFPMGWDAFGLPAEQYALKTGVHPAKVTADNINNFRIQAKSLGLSFDWSREFSTTDPKVYKWTQWIFLNLFKHGLAYQAESQVWWCEELKSVLADEEVINGHSERGDYPCERKPLRQWMLAITKYADRLDADLDDVDYIEPVKVQQRNWIGRSKGAEIKFQVDGKDDKAINVFTTRADTLYGVTYLVLAPEHPLVSKLTTNDQKESVEIYVKSTATKSELTRQEDAKDKSGVFIGAYATNPINGEKIPVWISDYVLMNYGTGAIMAVPAHDQRDNEFAKKFNLPILNVVNPSSIRSDSENAKEFTQKDKIVAVVVNDKNEVLTINWGPKLGGRLLIGGTVEAGEGPRETAKREVTEETGYTDLDLIEIGDETYNYKYYAFSKGKHYDVKCKFVYFKLKSDSQIEQKLDKSEENNFKVEWVSVGKAEKDIVEPLHKYAFDKFILSKIYGGEGIMTNSDKYDDKSSSNTRELIVAELEAKKQGIEVTNYKLRDWVFSRQRYWGEPFPIVWVEKSDYDKANGEIKDWLPEKTVTKQIDDKTLYALPIPPSELPLLLPEVEDFKPQGLGKGPLALATEWSEIWYNLANGKTVSSNQLKPGDDWVKATRETDTMPNWAGSSWYFLRYLDPNNDNELASKEKIKEWMPVNWYNGGMEHTTLHLLYSRFWHKFLFDIGVVNTNEPYLKRTSHGLILSDDGRKMSKSVGNVVDPMDVVESYGADTLRLFICFIGPFDQSVAWNVSGIAGSRRFIERLWAIVQDFIEAVPTTDNDKTTQDVNIKRILAKTNQKVSLDIASLGFNTAVSALMEAINQLYKLKQDLSFTDASGDWRAALRELVILCSPFIPHIAEELWIQLGGSDSVISQSWPLLNDSILISENTNIVVQVNGKLRSQMDLSRGMKEDEVAQEAKKDAKVIEHLGDKNIKKIIYVPDKLINFVTS